MQFRILQTKFLASDAFRKIDFLKVYAIGVCVRNEKIGSGSRLVSKSVTASSS